MDFKIVISIVIGFFVSAAAWMFLREFMSTKRRVARLEERVTKLERANHKRMPYQAMEEILDGLAALDVRDREVEFEKSVLENARAHFTNALAVGTRREDAKE